MLKSPIYHNAKGPRIHADFVVRNGLITTVNLMLNGAPSLGWRIFSTSHSDTEEMISAWINLYCKREEPTIKLPVEMGFLAPFTGKVLEFLATIPFGTSSTYKGIAEKVQNPKAARAVGNACGSNPVPLIIPCHRVLAANNKIGGFSCGIEIKKTLLEFERLA